MRYLNKGGSHTTLEGKIIANGATFDSDDKDLRKKFPNKFDLVAADAPLTRAPVAATPAPEAPAATEEPVNVAPEEVTTPGADGADVTAEFPTASKNELTVRKDKTGYWVLDDTDAVNEKALRSKKAVEAAIADYIKG